MSSPLSPRQDFQNAVVLDLDGTVLHAPQAELAVFGRTEYRYMSAGTAGLLAEISRMLPVIIATGRNARSAGRLISQLTDIRFAGFVLENGMIARREMWMPQNDPRRCPAPWESVREKLPRLDLMPGYEDSLALRIPDHISPADIDPAAEVRSALAACGCTGHYYREGRKIFVYPRSPSKLRAVQSLGFFPFIMLGDYLNDLDAMEAAAHCGTLPTAHEKALRLVRRKGGCLTAGTDHAGSEELLRWAVELLRSARPAVLTAHA